ncbi:hypothetical protein ACGGVA_004580, partial [Salmonella enterica]
MKFRAKSFKKRAIFQPIKTAIESVLPLHFHSHDHQICGRKIKPRLSGGRLHFVNPSTHSKCFF